MNINEMTPEEKSVMLARLRGDAVDCHCGKPDCKFGCESHQRTGRDWFLPDVKNPYDPQNMALAWEIGVWAGDNLPNDSIRELNDFWMRKDTYPYGVFMWYEPNAQQMFLDKILELAIGAGMVEEQP